ncbi:MAG TPA: histidine phosphatase family protein [Chryseosolibacter sp.]|nr:histidine phosphatase family protein [Chryseosolibacter sp.]
MSKKIHLLRHAHSVDRQPGQDDKDRFLSPTGIDEAKLIGSYLDDQQIVLDSVITSSAVRANATALLVMEEKKGNENLIITDTLYESTTRAYLECITSIHDNAQTVLLVGHNPLITYLAEYLTKNTIGDIVTCGLVTINFEIDSWKEVSEGNGILLSYVYPAMLR